MDSFNSITYSLLTICVYLFLIETARKYIEGLISKMIDVYYINNASNQNKIEIPPIILPPYGTKLR